jgi:integrase
VYSYLTTGGKNLRWRVEPIGGGAGGKAGFKTQQEALEWQRLNQGPPAVGTVGEWLTRWLELHKPNVEKATYVHDSSAIRRLIRPHLGLVKLRDLTGLHVAQMLATLAGESYSHSERHKAGRVLRRALNAAVELGVMAANPMTGARRVRLPGPRHEEKRVFTDAEVRALLKAADAQGKGHVVRLWLDSGLRPGELLGLDWEDFDWKAGTVKVVRAMDATTHEIKDVKTRGSRRTIRLSEATIALLKSALLVGVNQKSGPFLRPKRARGGRYWDTYFRRKWVWPLFEAAGVMGKGYGGYTFRHWMATSLIRRGVPIKVVSRRLGHTNITTTLAVYAHLMEGDDDRAAEVMGRILG